MSSEQAHGSVAAAPVQPWVHLVAGGLGGMAGSLFTCPLDVIKTRLQSDFYRDHNFSKNKSARRHFKETLVILRSIYRGEGVRGLFKGLGPNLVGVIPSRSINFFTYGVGKDLIGRWCGSKDSGFVQLGAAAVAGIVTSTATNPIWLVKTRLQLDKAATVEARQYRNSWSCISQVVRNEGVSGLYHGLTASYLGVVESSMQWVLYEQMKRLIRRHEQARAQKRHSQSALDSVLTGMATSGSAGLAKLVASLVTYPHEVVRTRLRQPPLKLNGQMQYTGLVSCFRTVLRDEGFRALYGGLTPHLLRTVPNSIIMFGVWELVVRALSRR